MLGWVNMTRWMLVLVLCGMTLPGHAFARHPKNTQRAEILVLENRWRQAQLADDVPSMDKLLSDDFLGVTASGQLVTKLQQLDRMRRRSVDIRKMELSDTKIKIDGPVAIVTSLAVLDGTADGRPLHGDFRYTRVYRHVPGDGWKITNFEATRVESTRVTPQANAAMRPEASSNSPLTSLAKFVSRRPRS